jgi:hypothetical protein
MLSYGSPSRLERRALNNVTDGHCCTIINYEEPSSFSESLAAFSTASASFKLFSIWYRSHQFRPAVSCSRREYLRSGLRGLLPCRATNLMLSPPRPKPKTTRNEYTRISIHLLFLFMILAAYLRVEVQPELVHSVNLCRNLPVTEELVGA